MLFQIKFLLVLLISSVIIIFGSTNKSQITLSIPFSGYEVYMPIYIFMILSYLFLRSVFVLLKVVFDGKKMILDQGKKLLPSKLHN